MKFGVYAVLSGLRFIALALFVWWFAALRCNELVEFTTAPDAPTRCAQCFDASLRNPGTFIEFESCARMMDPKWRRVIRRRSLEFGPGSNLQIARSAEMAKGLFLVPITVIFSVLTLVGLYYFSSRHFPQYVMTELDGLLSLTDFSEDLDDPDQLVQHRDHHHHNHDHDHHHHDHAQPHGHDHGHAGSDNEHSVIDVEGGYERIPLRADRPYHSMSYGSMDGDESDVSGASSNALQSALDPRNARVRRRHRRTAHRHMSPLQVEELKALHILSWSLALLILSMATSFSTLHTETFDVASSSFVNSHFKPLFMGYRVARRDDDAPFTLRALAAPAPANSSDASILRTMAGWFDSVPFYLAAYNPLLTEKDTDEAVAELPASTLINTTLPSALIVLTQSSPSSTSSSSSAAVVPSSLWEAGELALNQPVSGNNKVSCVVSSVPPRFLRWMDVCYSAFISCIIVMFFLEEGRISAVVIALFASFAVVCMGIIGLSAILADAWISWSWESIVIAVSIFLAFNEVPFLAYPLEKSVGAVDFPRVDTLTNPLSNMARLLLGSQTYRAISNVFSMLMNRFIETGFRGL